MHSSKPKSRRTLSAFWRCSLSFQTLFFSRRLCQSKFCQSAKYLPLSSNKYPCHPPSPQMAKNAAKWTGSGAIWGHLGPCHLSKRTRTDSMIVHAGQLQQPFLYRLAMGVQMGKAPEFSMLNHLTFPISDGCNMVYSSSWDTMALVTVSSLAIQGFTGMILRQFLHFSRPPRLVPALS